MFGDPGGVARVVQSLFVIAEYVCQQIVVGQAGDNRGVGSTGQRFGRSCVHDSQPRRRHPADHRFAGQRVDEGELSIGTLHRPDESHPFGGVHGGQGGRQIGLAAGDERGQVEGLAQYRGLFDDPLHTAAQTGQSAADGIADR